MEQPNGCSFGDLSVGEKLVAVANRIACVTLAGDIATM
jgi:hypothetical protein